MWNLPCGRPHWRQPKKIQEGVEQTKQLRCYEKTYKQWQELKRILKMVVGKMESFITLQVTYASLDLGVRSHFYYQPVGQLWH